MRNSHLKNSIKETLQRETQYNKIESIKALALHGQLFYIIIKIQTEAEVNPGIIDGDNSPPGATRDVIHRSPLILHQD